MAKGWRLTLTVDKGNTHGDLNVTGFVTERTARDVGSVFKNALAGMFPGTGTVVMEVNRDE